MNRTVRNILFFFFAVVVGKFVGSLTSSLVAKYLLPANYGVWITLLLICTFSPIICFGTVETLLKEVPYYKGNNDAQKVKEIEDGVFSSIIISAILLVLIGLNFYGFMPNLLYGIKIWQISVMFLAAALGLFSAYFYQRFASYQNFKMVSTLDSVRAITSFFFLITGARYWGLPGLVVGYFLNELLLCTFSAVLNIRLCGKIGYNFNWKLQRDLIKIGFPITIIWWVFIVQAGAGRIISMSILGETATGFLGLGTSIVSIIMLIPQTVGIVLYPKIGEKLGKGATKDELNMLVMVPARFFAIVTPLLIGVLLILSPFIYTRIFPQYSPGLSAVQILLLGVYFLCILRSGVNYIIGINRQNTLLKYFLFSLIVNVIASIVLVKLNLNINGIALGQSISAAVLSTLIWRSVFANMGYVASAQFKALAFLYLPFLILTVLGGIVKALTPQILNQFTILSYYSAVIFVVLFSTLIISIPHTRKWIKDIYTMVRSRSKKPYKSQGFVEHPEVS